MRADDGRGRRYGLWATSRAASNRCLQGSAAPTRFCAGVETPPAPDKLIARPSRPPRLFERHGPGGGWLNVGQVSGRDLVGWLLAHRNPGPRPIRVMLGRAARQDDGDAFALVWAPRTRVRRSRRRKARGLWRGKQRTRPGLGSRRAQARAPGPSEAQRKGPRASAGAWRRARQDAGLFGGEGLGVPRSRRSRRSRRAGLARDRVGRDGLRSARLVLRRAHAA